MIERKDDYTPSLDQMRDLYVRHADQLGIASDHVLHAEFDRFITATEQRGAAQALRDVEGSLIDWDVLYGYEQGTAEDHESIRIAAWIGRRADLLEGDDETH